MQEQTRQAAARGDAAVTPLSELELIPYLDKEGMVSKVDTTGVKASVYAVYDEVKDTFHGQGYVSKRKTCRTLVVPHSVVYPLPLCCPTWNCRIFRRCNSVDVAARSIDVDSREEGIPSEKKDAPFDFLRTDPVCA